MTNMTNLNILDKLNCLNDEQVSSLFEQLKKGFVAEKNLSASFYGNHYELERYIICINPQNALNSDDMAFCAGRYQAYFGAFLKTIENKGEAEKNALLAEIKKLEEVHAHNFSVLWQNAVYLKSIGK